MPTKPSSTFVWAKNPNYTVGPFIGSSTKLTDPQGSTEGSVPGDTIIAEYINQNFNITGNWLTDWLNQGSASADLDSHIVETDTDGASALAVLALGGTTASDFPLFISKNTGDPSTCIQGINDAGSVAIFKGSGAFATVSAEASDVSGQAISASHSAAGTAIAATAATGKAIVATSTSGTGVESSSTSGFAGLFTSNGNLAALRGVSSSASGPALEGLNLVSTGIGVKGQANSGTGLYGQSNLGIAIDGVATTGIAGRFTSTIGRAVIASNSSAGVQAIEASNSSTTGVGLFATTNNVLSTSAAKAIWGKSEGSGVGVFGESSSGIGVRGKTSGLFAEGVLGESVDGTGVQGTGMIGVKGSGISSYGVAGLSQNSNGVIAASLTDTALRVQAITDNTAPVRIDPNGSTPAAIEEGNLFFQGVNKNLFFVTEPSGGGAPKAFAAWGTQKGFVEGFGFDDFQKFLPLGIETTVVTTSLVNPHFPRIIGYIEITAEFYVSSGPGTIGWKIKDTTSAVEIGLGTFVYNTHINGKMTRRYLVPATGTRSFSLTLKSSIVGSLYEWATLSIKGVFDTATT